MSRQATFSLLLITSLVLGSLSRAAAAAPPSAAQPTKVLVLTGNEYPGHKWKETAPLLARFLAADARLATSVNADPKFLASPQLFDYDVVVLNYMNWQSPDPGPDARANLKKYVASGKGLVLVHFACGAFQGWPEFVRIVGRVYDPKLPPHDPYGKFTVAIADPEHPITKGMRPFETTDELYTCLAGNTPIHVVAKATSKVDKKDHPMAFVCEYGKGRVFHCVLGHDVKALSTGGVQELYRRGTAWAAGLPPTGGDASLSLAFIAAGKEYRFDTGTLRGTLRGGGRSQGLGPVVDIATGKPVARLYGLLSPYRLLTADARFGTAAWDWASQARLLENGAVMVRWQADQAHPLQMKAEYRLAAADTIDVTLAVKPEQDLRGFELFLASYFEGFDRTFAWGQKDGEQKSSLVEARRADGTWQMFLRDDEAKRLAGDGRWSACRIRWTGWFASPWRRRWPSAATRTADWPPF